MTRAELERRLRLQLSSLAASGSSAGDFEIAKEIFLDEIEKIVREVQDNAVRSIAKSVRRN